MTYLIVHCFAAKTLPLREYPLSVEVIVENEKQVSQVEGCCCSREETMLRREGIVVATWSEKGNEGRF